MYRCAKQRSEPSSDKRGAKVDELHLTPLELIDRIAALAPQPRTHRHRYFGVLAPNSPLRASVTAMAAPAQAASAQAKQASTGWAAILEHIGVGSEPPRSPLGAGRRCGMTATRGWARVSKSRRTGIRRRNRPPTLMSISASIGDEE